MQPLEGMRLLLWVSSKPLILQEKINQDLLKQAGAETEVLSSLEKEQ